MQSTPLTSDPRRPDRARAYRPALTSSEEVPADFFALISLISGVISLIFRYKLSAWCALFSSLASIANLKEADLEFRQVFTSLSFAIMSLFMLYISPSPPNINN